MLWFIVLPSLRIMHHQTFAGLNTTGHLAVTVYTSPRLTLLGLLPSAVTASIAIVKATAVRVRSQGVSQDGWIRKVAFIMHLLLSIGVFVLVGFLWLLRPLIFSWLLIVICFAVTPFYKSRADETIALLNKLEDEDSRLQLIKRYKHRFWFLKLTGLVVLILYAYMTARLVWLVLPLYWIFDIVFLGTIILYWQRVVTNISISYLALRAEKQTDN